MKFGLIYKEEDKKAKELAGRVREYLESKSQRVIDKKSLKGADFIVTLGGDGTLIHTACKNAPLGIPLIGINTGNLGFLTAAEAGDWKEAIDELIRGGYFISERITLDVSVESESKGVKELEIFRAVNEAAIKGFLRIATLDVSVNSDKLLHIVGDGVIVAGQTGSTAYSLSSGGPIVDPDLDCFLVTPINPIGLPIPSVVLSPHDQILVEVVKGDDVALIIDGQAHAKVTEGQSIKVCKGKYSIKLIYFDKHHFIKSLNAKFGLSGRIAS